MRRRLRALTESGVIGGACGETTSGKGVAGVKSAAGALGCDDLGGELEPDVKKVGVGMLGMKPEGIEMEGKALDSLFKALSPTDCDRCCLDWDWNAAAIDDLNRPGSTVNCFGPACHGVGSRARGDWRPGEFNKPLGTV